VIIRQSSMEVFLYSKFALVHHHVIVNTSAKNNAHQISQLGPGNLKTGDMGGYVLSTCINLLVKLTYQCALQSPVLYLDVSRLMNILVPLNLIEIYIELANIATI
jgi:hypothetical protein